MTARVESVNARIRRAVKARGHFPNEQAGRTGYDSNTYELVTAPQGVLDGARRLVADLGLTYGALDFVISPDGTWTFLEINAGGQYGWIEDETGAPLTHHLADLLTSTPPVERLR